MQRGHEEGARSCRMAAEREGNQSSAARSKRKTEERASCASVAAIRTKEASHLVASASGVVALPEEGSLQCYSSCLVNMNLVMKI